MIGAQYRGVCSFLPGTVLFILLLGKLFAITVSAIETPALVQESEYLIHHLTIDEGLPQNSVTSIAQTPDGYLWLGTFNGLVRFDGVAFKVFQAETTPELRSSRIVGLHADRLERLWIMSEFGDLTLLEDGRFSSLNKAGVKVAFVIDDAGGHVWFKAETPEALHYLERFDTGERLIMADDPGTNWGWVQSVSCDRDGVFWALRRRGVGFVQDGQFRFSSGILGAGLPDQLAPARDGGVWVTLGSSSIAKVREGAWALAPRAFPFSAEAKVVMEDTAGNVWLGARGQGALRYGKDGSWQVFNTTNGLSHDSVRSIFEDREGTIWIGTDGGGLNRLSRRVFSVRGPKDEVVLSVTEDRDGQTWFGLNGGGVWRMKGGAMRPVECSSHVLTDWAIYADPLGDVWVGEHVKGGLVQLSARGCEQYLSPGASSARYVRSIYRDRAGRLWAGHLEGLLCYDEAGVTSFTTEDGLPVDDARALAEDDDGNLFAGLNGGGLAWRRGEKFEIYGRAQGLPSDRVWSLYADGQGSLWVGTFGGGLSRFRDGHFFNYGEKLPAEVVTSIIEDDSGFLWLGSMRGIYRVNRRELNAFADGTGNDPRYTRYTKSDGLSTLECSGGLQPSVWKAGDGKLWFATIQGLAVVDPNRLPRNEHPPQVSIEEARVDERLAGSSVDGKADGGSKAFYDYEGALRIPAKARRLEFHYAAMSFLAPERVRYKYRMEGVDKDWVDAGSRRVGYYARPSPGEYEFRVIACNSDGVWNETGASIALIVEPLFRETIGFKGAVLLAAIGLVAGVYRVRLAQIQAVNRLRLRIAADLHDDLGANLGSIRLNTTLLMDDPGLSERQRGDLREISGVTSQTAQAVRDIVWFTNPDFDNAGGMIRRMREVAQLLLVGREWSFETGDVDLTRPLPLELRRSVYFSFKEALHNVVKHSGASKVEARATLRGNTLEFTVSDNGRGFEAEARETWNGLRILQRRAQEHGGECRITSRPGEGVRLEWRIPLQRQGRYFRWARRLLPKRRD